MLIIAIPLLFSVRLPLQQKAVLLIIFGMGVFVIVAAILTKIYCLVPSLITYVYLNWYFREASVSIYVTNLPVLWSLMRDIFPQLKSWGFESKKSNGSAKGFSSSNGNSRRNSRNQMNSRNCNMQSVSRLGARDEELGYIPSPRQKRINEIDGDVASAAPVHRTLEIQRDITFTVEKKEVDDLEYDSEFFVRQKRGETHCTSPRWAGILRLAHRHLVWAIYFIDESWQLANIWVECLIGTVAPPGSIDDFAVDFGNVDLRNYLWTHFHSEAVASQRRLGEFGISSSAIISPVLLPFRISVACKNSARLIAYVALSGSCASCFPYLKYDG